MTVVMFQPQFEAMIVAGRKVHTIRPKRKRGLVAGQELSFRVWTDRPYRSLQREFFRARVAKVEPVFITLVGAVYLNGVCLLPEELARFAWRDGFDQAALLVDWFKCNHALPFGGEVIYWTIA